MKLSEITTVLVESPSNVKVHNLSDDYAEGGSAAYDRTQTDEAIKDGDVLYLGGDRVAIMVKAWPVEVTGDIKKEIGFHKKNDNTTWEEFKGGAYKNSISKAFEIVK